MRAARCRRQNHATSLDLATCAAHARAQPVCPHHPAAGDRPPGLRAGRPAARTGARAGPDAAPPRGRLRAGDLERRYAELGIEEDFFVNYGFLSAAHHALMHPRKARARWSKARQAQGRRGAGLRARARHGASARGRRALRARQGRPTGSAAEQRQHRAARRHALPRPAACRAARRRHAVYAARDRGRTSRQGRDPRAHGRAGRRDRRQVRTAARDARWASWCTGCAWPRRSGRPTGRARWRTPRSASPMRASMASTGTGRPTKTRRQRRRSPTTACGCWRRSIRWCGTAAASSASGAGPTASRPTRRRPSASSATTRCRCCGATDRRLGQRVGRGSSDAAGVGFVGPRITSRVRARGRRRVAPPACFSGCREATGVALWPLALTAGLLPAAAALIALALAVHEVSTGVQPVRRWLRARSAALRATGWRTMCSARWSARGGVAGAGVLLQAQALSLDRTQRERGSATALAVLGVAAGVALVLYGSFSAPRAQPIAGCGATAPWCTSAAPAWRCWCWAVRCSACTHWARCSCRAATSARCSRCSARSCCSAWATRSAGLWADAALQDRIENATEWRASLGRTCLRGAGRPVAALGPAQRARPAPPDA